MMSGAVLRTALASAALSTTVLACRSSGTVNPTNSVGSGGGGDASGGGVGDGGSSTLDASGPVGDPWLRCNHVPVEQRCRDSWCEIPPGCFVMGSPTDELGHPAVQEDQVVVTLTRPFLIQQTELTQAEWTSRGFVNPSGSQPDELSDCLDDPQCPVGRVTWFEALAYANLISQQHVPPLQPCYILHGCEGEIGKDFYCTAAEASHPTVYDCGGFRLPTDAEWEYAARAGTRTAFYSGDISNHPEFTKDPAACLSDPNLERIAWYCYNSGGTSHPVAKLEPNGWGLFDMSGNAEELINDRSDGRPAVAEIDPDGTVGLHTNRNTRGGAFYSWSRLARSASQLAASWNLRSVGLGFRLARTGKLEEL